MFSKIENAIKKDVQTVEGTYQGLGITASIFSFFQGRATTFAILFATEGIILMSVGVWGFIHGKDLTGLSSLISSIAVLDGAIFTGVVGHSLKEDYFEMRRRQNDNPPPAPPGPASADVNVQVNKS